MLEKISNLITNMSELEEAIGRLYIRYADVFPDHGEFWTQMASEEKQHALWIRNLQFFVMKGSINFTEDRFKLAAIETFIKYLNDESEKIRAGERSLMNALSITLYIEQSLMELEYFKVVEGDSLEIIDVLNNLSSATQNHVARVRDVFNRYKSSSG